MSNSILPDFAGFGMDRKRNPRFANRIKTTISGREVRNRFAAYPVWHFTRPVEALINDLDADDLNQLTGFYMVHGGQDDSWLYDCPGYNRAESVWIGTGNGSSTQFQLLLGYPWGFVEPVHNPKNDVQILVDEVLQTSGYSLGGTGLVTFATAPAPGQLIVWSGGYYYRCRFDFDLPDFNESLPGVFDYADYSFIGSPVNLL